MRQVSLVKIIAIFLVSISAWSCTRYNMPNTAPSEFVKMRKDATPEFRQGWEDGCESGSAAGSNFFYKGLYKINKVDGYKVTQSEDYKTAWNFSWWYCYRYMYVKHKSNIWGSFFGGYK